MNLSQNKDKGVIKSKSLVDLLNKKVELKTELIRLKKEKKQPNKQEVLTESIAMIDEFLSKHKIQK